MLTKLSIRGIIQFPSCLATHCFVGKFIESVLASLAKVGGCTGLVINYFAVRCGVRNTSIIIELELEGAGTRDTKT